MASKKTWIWIIVTVLGLCVLALFVLAGAGVYFVTRHITATKSSSANALEQFERARAPFKDQSPLIELDEFDHSRAVRPVSELPTSPTRPDHGGSSPGTRMRSRQARQRVTAVLAPAARPPQIRRDQRRSGFDFDRLNIDVHELERIGPALVLDFRRSSGERVLIWTQ